MSRRVGRTMLPPARLLVALGVGALLLAVAPASASASCFPAPPIDEAIGLADIVFVGTVAGAANENRLATVSVEEVWKGPNLARIVTVDGGPGGGAVASSVDRSYVVGAKYLFVLSGSDQPGLRDNVCTSTTEWFDGLAVLRPIDARAPLASSDGQGGFDLLGIATVGGTVLLLAGVLLGVGLLARGRQPA